MGWAMQGAGWNPNKSPAELEIQHLREDMGEMKRTVERVAELMEKLVRVEERQSTTSEQMGRAFSSIKGLEERVRQLERDLVKPVLFSGWLQTALGVAVGAIGSALLKGAGVG